MANEKRLIDANAVKKNKFYLSRPTLDKEAVNEVLANCPTVDAVEVVRCKDCVHWNKDALSCDTLPWANSYEHANWYAEDFCSYGKRRT